MDAATIQELIAKLAADRDTYLESVNKTHQLLIAALSQSAAAPTPNKEAITDIARKTTATLEVESVSQDRVTGSTFTGDDSDDEDDKASYFVQTPLPRDVYTMEGLRQHIREYDWTEAGLAMLNGLQNDEKTLSRKCLFPTESGPVDDRSHLSHYSIFDVGADGAPLEIKSVSGPDPSRSMAIWNRLRSTNEDPDRQSPAVGRIIIVREPSPLLFATLHYTMNKHFKVDELFELTVDDNPRLGHPHRPFDEDDRLQRSFVFTMEYFTIIGDGCKPMTWQLADQDNGQEETHVPISRCSSTVSLSLSGPRMGRVRNKERRVDRKYGDVYDPFSPWRVLSIQAYPDLRHSVDSHDSTKHYMNGPEAFLVTLRAEFRDARKRLYAVYDAVSDLIEPPSNFMFHAETRDKLLFEDGDFTFSRRYHWAYQSLSIMNQDIHEMITAYRETFKDSVWDGSNKIIWPGEASISPRHAQWRRRMAVLRKDLEYEMARLGEIVTLNENKMKEIKGLRDSLFSGTSVFESRQSVQNSRITVEQGRNIRLLTLVTIFFLPLTFVTSVYGMTPINPDEGFVYFGATTVSVCIPTYLIIGSLNTPAGLEFWKAYYNILSNFLGQSFARFLAFFGYKPMWARHYNERNNPAMPQLQPKKKSRHKRLDTTVSGREDTLEMRGAFNGMPHLSETLTFERDGPKKPARQTTAPPPLGHVRQNSNGPNYSPSPQRGYEAPRSPPLGSASPTSRTTRFSNTRERAGTGEGGLTLEQEKLEDDSEAGDVVSGTQEEEERDGDQEGSIISRILSSRRAKRRRTGGEP